jgi:tetratricopeptide (TPR) repeat protein
MEQRHMSGNSWSAGHQPGAVGIYTETLARLYAKQGLYDQALRIYRHLLQTQPDNLEWQRTIAAIERQRATDPGPQGAAERAVQTASGKHASKNPTRPHQVAAQLARWLEHLQRRRQS